MTMSYQVYSRALTILSSILWLSLIPSGGSSSVFAQTPYPEEGLAPNHLDWSFDGIFGTFDRGQLQRGFKVYEEVCSACHGLEYLYYRNLGDTGGPEFSSDAVNILAERATVSIIDHDTGDTIERSGLPQDPIKGPFANKFEAAAANGGKSPPDLTLMAKARHDGTNYIYSLLTGYLDTPRNMEIESGLYFNPYFPRFKIGMAPPLSNELVEYDDDTPQTADNYARDVAAFLTWAAEPKLESRRRTGVQVLLFLAILAGLLYWIKLRIWAKIEH